MSDPFRDGMSAALARIDQLAERNEELQKEVERLRTHAHTVKASTTDEHAHALADQTLRMLDQLEILSERRPEVAPAARVEIEPKPNLEERADESVVVPAAAKPLPPPDLNARPPPRPSVVAPTFWIVLCCVCFAAGVLIGAVAIR